MNDIFLSLNIVQWQIILCIRIFTNVILGNLCYLLMLHRPHLIGSSDEKS